MAIAERILRHDHGTDLVDHRTWVIAGDGCLEEGISHEAASLAGSLGLDRLTVFYDDNHITIDGPTELALRDDARALHGVRLARHQSRTKRANDLDELEARRRGPCRDVPSHARDCPLAHRLPVARDDGPARGPRLAVLERRISEAKADPGSARRALRARPGPAWRVAESNCASPEVNAPPGTRGSAPERRAGACAISSTPGQFARRHFPGPLRAGHRRATRKALQRAMDGLVP